VFQKYLDLGNAAGFFQSQLVALVLGHIALYFWGTPEFRRPAKT
jgi:hypothetical protein